MAAPCAGFVDVDDTSPFCANVAWIKNRGVTLGCDANLYCPDASVTRLAMAAFLNRLGDAVLPPRVLWVANAGGTFASIQAAIDHAAAQGASEFSTWLVKVAPGSYNERVTMKDGVDVEGAGRGLTLIYSGAAQGTVATGAKAELRRVTVENTGANPHPFVTTAAVWHSGGPSRLVDVALRGWGSAYSVGLFMASGHLSVEGSRIQASGAAFADAIVHVPANGRLTLRDVDIGADTSIGQVGQGIVSHGGIVTVDAARIGVFGTSDTSTGIRVNGGELVLENSTVTTIAGGGGAANPATGLLNQGSATVRNSTLSASGHTAHAVNNSGTASVHASSLLATGTVNSLSFVHAGAVGRIAHTQLVGPTSGSPTCFGTFDATFTAVACP